MWLLIFQEKQCSSTPFWLEKCYRTYNCNSIIHNHFFVWWALIFQKEKKALYCNVFVISRSVDQTVGNYQEALSSQLLYRCVGDQTGGGPEARLPITL